MNPCINVQVGRSIKTCPRSKIKVVSMNFIIPCWHVFAENCGVYSPVGGIYYYVSDCCYAVLLGSFLDQF